MEKATPVKNRFSEGWGGTAALGCVEKRYKPGTYLTDQTGDIVDRLIEHRTEEAWRRIHPWNVSYVVEHRSR